MLSQQAVSNDYGVAPFSGFVFNLNPVTRLHFDCNDLRLCVAFALGIFTGGELILDGPCGVVLPMRPGDVAVYDSANIPHYNLTFRGRRMSVVMNMDRVLRSAKDLADTLEKKGYRSLPAVVPQYGKENGVVDGKEEWEREEEELDED